MNPFILRIQRILIGCLIFTSVARSEDRPNIFFFFADDWGRYASIYRDPHRLGLNDVIETPALDRIGCSGVVFNNPFVPAPWNAVYAVDTPIGGK